MKGIISPSLLSCDFSHLYDEVFQLINRDGADWIHVDIMDGHFVKNLTMGPPVLECVSKKICAFYDCHLMVDDPLSYVESMKKAGCEMFTFHFEAVVLPPSSSSSSSSCGSSRDLSSIHRGNLENIVNAVREAHMFCGVAIKPDTPVEELWEYIDLPSMVDLVLVMTVEPGFTGQVFNEGMLSKVTKLRKKYPNLLIQVVGGVNKTYCPKAANAGANVFVAGAAIFHEEDRKAKIDLFRRCADESAALETITHDGILQRMRDIVATLRKKDETIRSERRGAGAPAGTSG